MHRFRNAFGMALKVRTERSPKGACFSCRHPVFWDGAGSVLEMRSPARSCFPQRAIWPILSVTPPGFFHAPMRNLRARAGFLPLLLPFFALCEKSRLIFRVPAFRYRLDLCCLPVQKRTLLPQSVQRGVLLLLFPCRALPAFFLQSEIPIFCIQKIY